MEDSEFLPTSRTLHKQFKKTHTDFSDSLGSGKVLLERHIIITSGYRFGVHNNQNSFVMKAIILLITIGVLCAGSACNKCYECTNYPSPGTNTKACKGEALYDVLRDGGKLTNNQGQDVSCKQ